MSPTASLDVVVERVERLREDVQDLSRDLRKWRVDVDQERREVGEHLAALDSKVQTRTALGGLSVVLAIIAQAGQAVMGWQRGN